MRFAISLGVEALFASKQMNLWRSFYTCVMDLMSHTLAFSSKDLSDSVHVVCGYPQQRNTIQGKG